MKYGIAKIKDKIRLYEKTGNESSTYFMTPAEILEVMEIIKNYEYALSGGFEEAERRIIIIGNSNPDLQKYFAVVRIQCFEEPLKHRNVLGSLLGLGIKREMIGDIIVNDKICDIIIIREMLNYVISNLDKVGRQKVISTEIKLNELMKNETHKEEVFLTVSSLRIDAVISAAFSISREKSSKLISSENVFLNFLPCVNISKQVKEHDLISARGYGRIRLVEKLGETRKGRARIKVERS